MRPVFLAVAGNIGSGKTTISQVLANHFGWRCFEEPADKNPFLAKFYADPRAFAFRAQRFFLLSRIVHHEIITHADAPCVQDRSIYEDGEIFAKMQRDLGHMSSQDWAKYQRLYQNLIKDLRPPDLLVYLRTSLEVLRTRIKIRGRPYETALMNPKDPYLKRLSDAYERWVDSYNRGRKLIVNSDNLDLTTDAVHVKKLVLTIERMLENQTQLAQYYEP